MDIATAVAKVKSKMDGGTKLYQQVVLTDEQAEEVEMVLQDFVDGIVGDDEDSQARKIAELQTKRKDYVTMMAVMCASREVAYRLDGYAVEPIIAKMLDKKLAAVKPKAKPIEE